MSDGQRRRCLPLSERAGGGRAKGAGHQAARLGTTGQLWRGLHAPGALSPTAPVRPLWGDVPRPRLPSDDRGADDVRDQVAWAGRWLPIKQADLDRGVSLDDRAGSVPLSDWSPPYLRAVEATVRPSTPEQRRPGLAAAHRTPPGRDARRPDQAIDHRQVDRRHGRRRRLLVEGHRDRRCPQASPRPSRPRQGHRHEPMQPADRDAAAAAGDRPPCSPPAMSISGADS